MSIIPEVKCRRCGETFSSLRSTCPNCGTRRVAQSSRTPDTTPSTVRGTASYERAAVNTRWQLIFGLILVVAVILAVIVMVSTGLNNNESGTTVRDTPPPPTDNVDTPPEVESPPTPTPSPTPQVQTLEIVYTYDDKKRDDVTVSIGEKLPLTAKVMPADIQGKVTWSIDEEGKDTFKLTVDPNDGNKVEVECVGPLPADSGGVYIYADIYGQQAKCMLHVRR